MTPPHPSRSLVLCSLAALILCAVLCAACTALMLHPWGIHSLAGLLLLPGVLGLGLTQYAGTFQGKSARAEMVARLYSFTGGFMLIALACLLLDIARSGEHPSWAAIAVGAVFVVVAVWGRLGGRLNREWAAELRRFDETEGSESPRPTRRGHPWVWLTTCVVFLVSTGAFYWTFGPQSGEHVAPDTTPLVLPEGASDVCYWIYAGNTVFEFTISEQGFLAWAELQIERRQGDFEGMKALDGSESVPIYRAWLPDAPPPDEAVVEEGYYHGWQEAGKTVQYAYDQRTGRAYYAAISRPLLREELNPEP
jgi:hypothetical protein